MNATEETIREYVEALHETTREVSARFLSPDHAKEVLHNSFASRADYLLPVDALRSCL
jgi:hypothetical protein